MAPVSYCAGIGIGHREARICVVRDTAIRDAQLVATETGARSLPTCLAFSAGGEWIVGDAAKAQQAKNEAATICDILSLLPRAGDDAGALGRRLKESGQGLVAVSEDGLKIAFRPKAVPTGGDDDDDAPPQTAEVTAEEALTKVLVQLKQVADDFVGFKRQEDKPLAVGCVVACDVEDAVAEAALVRAAKAARLDVQQRIGDALAVALEAGAGLEDTAALLFHKVVDKPSAVAVVDVGATRSSCTLYARSTGGVLRQAAAPAVTSDLSAAKLTACLERHCATYILKRQKVDVQEGGRKAVAKLKAACERAARLLAAGATQADVEAEALVDGVDCRVRVTKARFEDLAAPLYALLTPLVQEACAAAAAKGGDDDDDDGPVLVAFAGAASKAGLIQQTSKAAVAAATRRPVLDENDLRSLRAAANNNNNNNNNTRREADEAATFGAAAQASLLAFGDSGADPADYAKVGKHSAKITCPRTDAVNAKTALPCTAAALTIRVAHGATPETLRVLVPKLEPLPHKVSTTLAHVSKGTTVTFLNGDRPIATLTLPDPPAEEKKFALALDIAADSTLNVTLGETTFTCPVAAS